MELLTDPSISRLPDPAAFPEPTGPSELKREDFLRLLVAQLENQDPLKPNQDKEFIAQLATFSSLEQLITANDHLLGLAAGQASLINSQALSLIGKEALVESGGELRIRDGRPDSVVYVIPRPAQSATLTVYAPDGRVARVFDLERTAGRRVALEWDGTDPDGEPLPDGDYRFVIEARDASGEPMSVGHFRSLRIDGVNFGDGNIALVSGDREIPFDQILEFRAVQPGS